MPLKPTSSSSALVVIDSRPLQREVWAEFHAARNRLDKASRDLHRHEQIDTPAYDSWLHRTFPVLITRLRELHAEVALKNSQVQSVLYMAELTGRAHKKLWREQKERAANPQAFDEENEQSHSADTDADAADHRSPPTDSDDIDDDDFFKNIFSGAPSRPRSPAAEAAQRDAKAIYRRLVQHLHPDRGGTWTPVRQRLWHEVQQAWATADADWLARLEVEWETANEILGPTSAVSRLRRAIEELRAAQRDIERKLRTYRRSQHWRFTLSERKRPILTVRTEEGLHHDFAVLQDQLAYLNRTIAAWEKEPASHGFGRKHKRRWM